MKPLFYFLLCLGIGIGNVCADGFELEVGAATHHWVSTDLYENNRLIGTGYNRWEAATFINSFGDRSYSASYRWPLFWAFSLSGGIIHGYGENADWFPVTLDDEVIFVTLNAETRASSVLNLRLRVLGEATMVSVVIRPPEKSATTIRPEPAVTDPNASADEHRTNVGWPQ